MVVDSSVTVAVHLREPGYPVLLRKIYEADIVIVGSSTLLECAMVLTPRMKQDSRPLLTDFLRLVQGEVVPFEQSHLDAAITAFMRFGRGRHPARLNFGDCMSYAIASVAYLPLLFTGEDFKKTDILAA